MEKVDEVSFFDHSKWFTYGFNLPKAATTAVQQISY